MDFMVVPQNVVSGAYIALMRAGSRELKAVPHASAAAITSAGLLGAPGADAQAASSSTASARNKRRMMFSSSGKHSLIAQSPPMFRQKYLDHAELLSQLQQ